MAQDTMINSQGNSFLDILGQATSIVSGGANSLFQGGSTFIDSLTAYKISRAQSAKTNVVTNTVTNATDEDKIRTYLVYGVIALVGVGLTIYLVKK